ncbi:Extracellular protein [Penicillium sp. IBT 16267x]|nr:Extracellular protein [Penicillium sp. IBT 16267x]
MKGALLYSLLAGTATAHMQMMKPYPIRSPLNKNATGQKDYSYTNPLQASGSDYPCKGYANDPFYSQATYSQGQSYTMELDGSATHDGGSCQLSLTYDQGKSFKVIESMLGDCPIAKKYDFQIPSDAPDGEALLAWTWFNKVGNREMYMNCAMVTIGGSSNGDETEADADADTHTKNVHKPNKSAQMKVSHPPMAQAAHHGKMESQRGAKSQKQQDGFDSLPPLFVANVNQEGKCVTIEGEAVNFPKPGDNVLGKTDGKGDGYKCSGTAPFLASSSKSTSNDTSTDSSDSSSTANTNSKADKSSKTSTQDNSSKASKTTEGSTQAKTSTDSNQAKTTDSKDSKTNNNSKDSSKNATRRPHQSMSKIAQTWSTSAVADSRVVATDTSTNNAFSSYVNRFACTSGEIICAPDGFSWAMCSNGAPIFMGSVAAGMICRFGAMVAAPW